MQTRWTVINNETIFFDLLWKLVVVYVDNGKFEEIWLIINNKIFHTILDIQLDLERKQSLIDLMKLKIFEPLKKFFFSVVFTIDFQRAFAESVIIKNFANRDLIHRKTILKKNIQCK